jgi:hypothetical protein
MWRSVAERDVAERSEEPDSMKVFLNIEEWRSENVAERDGAWRRVAKREGAWQSVADRSGAWQSATWQNEVKNQIQ